VKCGGHSPGGASSSDGGIVIDLSLINSVTAKADEKTIIAGGGALWRDVSRVAAEYGLSCGMFGTLYWFQYLERVILTIIHYS
jgi:FAD/FMN-containing dehydrogenase